MTQTLHRSVQELNDMGPSAISAVFIGMDTLNVLPPNKLNDDPGQINIPEMICQMMGFPGLVHPHVMHVNPDEVAAALQQGPNSTIWSANVAAQPQHAESHAVHHDTQACVICREVAIEFSSHSVSPNGIDLLMFGSLQLLFGLLPAC